jgi:NAD(P)-dependent dehydrogenase (short-subunit alcohol dehydrogenase family)
MDQIFSLKGKTALITGGSQGIGHAISKGFSCNGCNVGILDKRPPEDSGTEIKYLECDLSDTDQINNSFNLFVQQFGTIDILLNCAGITISNSSEHYKLEDFLLTLQINLNAIFQLSKLTGNFMISNEIKGSIINLTSIGAEQGFPNNPAYGASKGGLKQLTKAMAADWGKYGIRVNNLVPGYTNTPMNKKSWNDKDLNAARAQSTFLGRWAEPDDMVGPAIFLASDASTYVTGSDLIVDGGWTAKGL